MKKKIIIMLGIMILIAVIDTFLFPVRVTNRVSYAVSGSSDIYQDIVSGKTSSGYYVSGDNECGYYTSSGEITHRYVSEQNKQVIANDVGYVVYDKFGSVVSIFTNSGKLVKDIQTPSYPHLIDGIPLVYLIKTNGCGFSSYTFGGDPHIVDFNTNSVITSISSNKYLFTLVSTLDGEMFIFGKTGELLDSYDYSGSAINYIKSCAVDGNGKYAAVMGGLDPEMVSVYDISNKVTYKSFNTLDNLTYSGFLKFYDDMIFYETHNFVKYKHIGYGRSGKYPYQGDLYEFLISDAGEIALLSFKDNVTYIYIYGSDTVLLYYGEVSGRASSISFVDKDTVIFKIDESLIRLSHRVTG